MNTHMQTQSKRVTRSLFLVAIAFLAFSQASLADPLQGMSEDEIVDFARFEPTRITMPLVLSDIAREGAEIRDMSVSRRLSMSLGRMAHTIQFDNNQAQVAIFLMSAAETNLLLLNDTVAAQKINNGIQRIGRNEVALSVPYIMGIAQDVRRSGAPKQGQYLESVASLVNDGLSEPYIGILDAAALSLGFDGRSYPSLALFLGMSLDDATVTYRRDVAADLFDEVARQTGNPAYGDTARRMRALSEEDVDAKREKIEAAQTYLRNSRIEAREKAINQGGLREIDIFGNQ